MKIIFTIILIFFGFFTNNAFASDIDLTNLNPVKPCPAPYQAGECYNDPNYPYNPDGSPKKPKLPGPTQPGEEMPDKPKEYIITFSEEDQEGENENQKIIKLKEGQENWDSSFLGNGILYRTQLKNGNTIILDNHLKTYSVTGQLLKNPYIIRPSYGKNINIFEYKDLVLFIFGPNKYENENSDSYMYILHKENLEVIYVGLNLLYDVNGQGTGGFFNFYTGLSENKLKVNQLKYTINQKGYFSIGVDDRNFGYGDLLFGVDLEYLNNNSYFFAENPSYMPVFKNGLISDFSSHSYIDFIKNESEKYTEKTEHFYNYGLFNGDGNFINYELRDLPFGFLFVNYGKDRKASGSILNPFNIFNWDSSNYLKHFIRMGNNGFGYIKKDTILYIADNQIGHFIINENGDPEKRYLNSFIDKYTNLSLFYNNFDGKYYISSILKNESLTSTFYGKINYLTLSGKLSNYSFSEHQNLYYLGNFDNGNIIGLIEKQDSFINQFISDQTQSSIFLTEEQQGIFLNVSGGGYIYKYKEPIIKKGEYKNFQILTTNSQNTSGGEQGENGGAVTGDSTKEKEKNQEEERKKQEREEANQLKKKEELEKQYNIFDSYFTGFKNFFGVFLITFPENYDNNLKIPILKPLIVDGKAKIQYKTVDTELKPIEDKLNIALIGENPDYIKKGLSMILGLFYLSCRVGIIFLSLIFLIYFYKYLNNILNLVFSSSFQSGTSNVIGLGAFVGFFTIFFSFCLIVLGHFTVLNPFFEIIINLLNLIFGFISTNFMDFQTFYSFTNFVTVSLYGMLGFYLVFRLLKTYGKLF